MNWVLGIDTSSVDMGIGIFKSGVPVASYSRCVINSHAEHISQTVTSTLSLNSVAPTEIKHIAITAGPACSVQEFTDSITPESIIVSDTMRYKKSTAFIALPSDYMHIPIEQFPTQRGFICASIGASMPEQSDVWIDEIDLHPNYLRSSAARLPSPKG